uniref:Uncharacterized protein n=1 Tax=Stomoxys calcitrans TaxID=35570 RepID=A0A1I8NYX3_STOCA
MTNIFIANCKLPLIYPKKVGSAFKLIFGFGVPWDGLLVETITSGMVWRVHFRLPGSLQQLKHRHYTTLGRRLDNWSEDYAEHHFPGNSTWALKNGLELEKYVHTSYRWGFYQTMEGLATRIGLNGRFCVLKSICEAAKDPFHIDNGLWAELLNILLMPSSSVDKLSQHSDNDYYQAEYMGRSGANCHKIFASCPRSLLDHFSNFYKLTDELRQAF